MKKILLYINVLSLLLIGACTEDKGTYDYVDLNEVVISGVDDKYIAISGKDFSINPLIKQAMFEDESTLQYLWFAYAKSSSPLNADTLARTKELHLDSLPLLPQRYTLTFKVIDVGSGIFYSSIADLDVKGFTNGLYVLSNNNGDAQVSILRGTEEGASHFEAFKYQNNGEIAGRNPVGIHGIWEFMRRGKPYRFIIACNDDNLGVYTTGDTFEKTIPVSDAFKTIPAPSNITGLLGDISTLNTSGATGLFGDGNLYLTLQPSQTGVPYGTECSFAYNFANYSPNFAAPYSSYFIIYNSHTKGFARTNGWKVEPQLPVNNANAPFEIANTGLDAIYGKKVVNNSMGIFVDPNTNQKYILALSGYKTAVFKIALNTENIETANHFEFMNTKQILYYASGNMIYVYDIVARKNLYSYALPIGAIIDKMTISTDDKLLYVGFGNGSNAPNGSSVHILNIDLDGEILDVSEAYDNKFGKIVDFLENY